MPPTHRNEANCTGVRVGNAQDGVTMSTRQSAIFYIWGIQNRDWGVHHCHRLWRHERCLSLLSMVSLLSLLSLLSTFQCLSLPHTPRQQRTARNKRHYTNVPKYLPRVLRRPQQSRLPLVRNSKSYAKYTCRHHCPRCPQPALFMRHLYAANAAPRIVSTGLQEALLKVCIKYFVVCDVWLAMWVQRAPCSTAGAQ